MPDLRYQRIFLLHYQPENLAKRRVVWTLKWYSTLHYSYIILKIFRRFVFKPLIIYNWINSSELKQALLENECVGKKHRVTTKHADIYGYIPGIGDFSHKAMIFGSAPKTFWKMLLYVLVCDSWYIHTFSICFAIGVDNSAPGNTLEPLQWRHNEHNGVAN